MKKLPEVVWAPVSAALLSLAVGATGVWAGLPWLFPSLGPTVFLQVHTPEEESSRPYHVIAGHACGVAAGVLGVWMAGAGHAPPVLTSHHLTWARVWAAAIAMGVTLLLQIPLRASHPPAAATALLLALGALQPEPKTLGVVAAGVVLVAVLGEALRRLRLAQG